MEEKAPKCPYFKECGGCSLLGTDYGKQLETKLERARQLLRPYCAVESVEGAEKPFHYRNKATATFSLDRRRGIICGRYAEGTRRVVPVDDCLIEDARADKIILTVKRLLNSFGLPPFDVQRMSGFLRHVLVRTSRTGGALVALVTGGPIFPSKNDFIRELTKACPEITTVVQSVNGERTGMILGERVNTLYGPGYIEDTLCGLRFRISAASFFQVNPAQTEKLYSAALEFAGLTGSERVVDAYCGIGTIALSAAARAGEVVGAEINAAAVRDAVANKKLNGIKNAVFVRADAAQFMEDAAQTGERVDVVFTDPPRAGCGERFISAVGSLAPARVVYISCNPATQAADLGRFAARGYRAIRARAFDMFPQTEHIETAVLLERRP